MLLYYDESGTFTFPESGYAISVVGLLIAPEEMYKQIEKDYLKIRCELPLDNGEIKGRLLSEVHVAKIVNMLLNHDVLFIAIAIDMGLHSKAGIELSKNNMEKAFTAGLTGENSSDIVKQVCRLNETLSKISLQLYIQSRLTFEVIKEALFLSTLYYCQRHPKTLERFEWVIDAKDKDKVTEGENWWKSTVIPIIVGDSIGKLIVRLNSGDYSYFQRFVKEVPEYLNPSNDTTENTAVDVS